MVGKLTFSVLLHLISLKNICERQRVKFIVQFAHMMNWHYTQTTVNKLGRHHHGQTALAANVHHSAPLSLSLSVLLSYSCIGTILHTILCPALALFADGRTGHHCFLSCTACGVQGDILSINVGTNVRHT